MGVQSYRELIVWQKSMDLVEDVYVATKQFPRDELYGLVSQLRRAVVSVPSNIAEGQGRSSTKDFLRFLSIALGSLKEAETLIFIARRLGYIDEPSQSKTIAQTAEVGRLINGLKNSLKPKLE